MTGDTSSGSRRWAHLRDSLRQSLGLVMVAVWTAFGEARPGWWQLGAALALGGVLVRLWASGYIKKNRELATDGPYAFVRHPLYVGNLLVAVGFAIACGLWWAWLMLGVFWLIFYPNAIRDEDIKLERLFGDAWRAWKAETRALLPRLTPYRAAAGDDVAGAWSLTQSLRSNGEPVIALFLGVCLYLLYRGLA